LRAEIAFNTSAGISEAEDRLPDFMQKESLPPDIDFPVSSEEIKTTFAPLKENS